MKLAGQYIEDPFARKGVIYWAKADLKLLHGKATKEQLAKLSTVVNILIVGWDWDDAKRRAHDYDFLEKCLWPNRRQGLKGKIVGVNSFEIIHIAGHTVHPIEPFIEVPERIEQT